MFKNVATKIALFAFDTATGAAKTGDAANLTAYVSKDYGAVTALTDTSATEMSSTNAPGWYVFDVAQAETNADTLLFTGKSSTSGVSVVGRLVDTVPALVGGRLDASVGAIASGVDFSATMKASINTEADTALADAGVTTTVTGRIDAAVSTRLASASYTAPLDAAGTRAAIGLASANLDTQIAAMAAYIDTEVAAIKAKTDNLPSDPADASVVAAQIAAVQAVVDAILIDTAEIGSAGAGLTALATAANLALVKAKTDLLTFTSTRLHVDTKAVAGVVLQTSGSGTQSIGGP